MEKLFLSREKQKEINTYMPDNKFLTNLASFFQMLSDKTRIKILTALCLTEMCVGDMAELLDINQTTVSHQLKLLKAFGVVESERIGKLIYYKICNENINTVMSSGVDYLIDDMD